MNVEDRHSQASIKTEVLKQIKEIDVEYIDELLLDFSDVYDDEDGGDEDLSSEIMDNIEEAITTICIDEDIDEKTLLGYSDQLVDC